VLNERGSVLAVDVDDYGLSSLDDREEARLIARTADLADPAVQIDLVEACVDAFGHLDVLANVVGIYVAGHSRDLIREQYRRLMAVNLEAPYFLSQAALLQLLASTATS
jgi:meso-butanediol dehydrogenase / (S,S)-butanediol dehydrogenase / diacetyl reductase